MSKKPLSFKVDAEKLIPFLSSITNTPKLNFILAMQLRKDLFSTRDTINMNDPVQIEKESLILGSSKRVKIAIKTLKDIGLIVEKIDPQNGQHVLVRNLSSHDTIRLLERLSRNMTSSLKTYINKPTDWPNLPIITIGYKLKKRSANRSRQSRMENKNKINEIS